MIWTHFVYLTLYLHLCHISSSRFHGFATTVSTSIRLFRQDFRGFNLTLRCYCGWWVDTKWYMGAFWSGL